MTLPNVRRLNLAAACLLLASAGFTPVMGKTVKIPTTDAHFDVPDDWTVTQRNDVALYAYSSASGASVTVTLFTNTSGKGTDDPQFIANMQAALGQRAEKESASMKMLSQGPTEINGVPADFIQAELAFPEGGVAYARSYGLAENGSVLVMTLLSRDPTADASLQAIARTLRFNHRPVQPGDNTWTDYHLGWGLLAFAAFLAAVLVILLIVRRRTA